MKENERLKTFGARIKMSKVLSVILGEMRELCERVMVPELVYEGTEAKQVQRYRN